MRAGGCTVQQALTNEAANVVKQAVTLARRRGHAQVTPLHVANTMLSSSTGLLRSACIQSHSHPLQCRALELCFNVALNRLPASASSSPMLGAHSHSHSHSQCPSISNALVAAFKRAQAHQRRGSIETQQQPLLAVKIELEQLIISILDDPSVSRVMREAGFSSTQVKSNVEQAVSLEISSLPSKSPKESLSSSTSSNNGNNLVLSPISPPTPTTGKSGKEEDEMFVIESLVRKKRTSFVVVGECVSSVEGVVRGVIDKVGKGDVPECLRHVKFINLSFSSLGHLNRVDVEQRVEEIKSHVRTAEIVLNLGDLKWAVENRVIGSSSSTTADGSCRGYYCPVEHMKMEIGKLLGCCNNNNNINGEISSGNMGFRFRVMGIATFQTYMRCKSGPSSLETLWGLHPLTIPPASLSLSLITTTQSDIQRQPTSKDVVKGPSSWNLVDGNGEIDDDDDDVDVEKQLNCCADCSAKFRNELGSLGSNTSTNESKPSPLLPPWFQHHKDTDQSKGVIGSNIDKESASISVSELCKKWNSFCNSAHKQSYISCFSHDHQQSWRSDGHFLLHNNNKEYPKQQAMLLSSSNPNSTPNSASNSSADDVVMEPYVHKFKELNAENLTTLCTALESKVPWQQHVVPEIVTTILKCRSGMLRRWNRIDDEDESWSSSSTKQETWLFFQGGDVKAKEMIARELARLVFGSQTNVVTIALSSFINHQDSSGDRSLKRSRDEESCMERFAEAVSSNPHRVFFIKDVEQADYCSQMRFKRAIERGRISNANGEEASLSDAIIILSCEFSSRSRLCSPQKWQEEKVGALDLNISIDEDTTAEEESVQDIGLLQSVDRKIIFNIKELSL